MVFMGSINIKASKICILIGKAVVTLSLCVFFITGIYQEVKEVRKNTLNFFMPRSFGVLVEATQQGSYFFKDKIFRHKNYYEKLVQYMPYRSEAQGLLGFCFYYLGQETKAIEAYQKAIELNPHFFWFYYNLGVIYSKSDQHALAMEYFQKAAQTKPQVALAFIRSSKMIYIPIIGGQFSNFGPVIEQLKKGYKNVYQFNALQKVRDDIPLEIY